MRLLALDTGKTKTFAVVIDEELRVLGSSVTGPGDVSLDPSLILSNIRGAIDAALKEAGLGLGDVDAIVISWAGLDTRADRELAERYAREMGLPMERVVIEHDAVTAFYAVTWGEPGIAIIAGTGAIAFGMNRRGERGRSSGWGWIIGDEGSAAWIALQALNAASRAYDGRGPWTSLVDRIREYFGVSDLLEIVSPIYRAKPFDISRIAGIAALVDEEAERGDEVARRIMERAGDELVDTVYSLARRLGMVDDPGVVGGVGSVFRSRIVRRRFEEGVRRLMPRAELREPLIGYRAIVGALIIGLRRLGMKVDQGVVDRLSRAIEEVERG